MKKFITMLAIMVFAAVSCTEIQEEVTMSVEQNLQTKLVGCTDGEMIPGTLLVKLDEKAAEDPSVGILDGIAFTSFSPAIPIKPKNIEIARKYGLHQWFILKFEKDISPIEVAEKLAVRKEVKSLQYSRMLQPSWDEDKVFPLEAYPVTKASSDNTQPFSDTYLSYQWNLINDGSIHAEAVSGADIGVKDAWRLCAGDPSVTAAVFDLGINTIHEDLRPALWVNEGEIKGNGKDDDNNGFIDDYNGFNFFRYKETEDGKIKQSYGIDCSKGSGHGTHVAGIIGAVCATLGVVLPSFIIIYLISMFFDNILQFPIITNAFRGIKIAVGLLIVNAGINMGKKIPKKPLQMTILAVSIALMLLGSFLSFKPKATLSYTLR